MNSYFDYLYSKNSISLDESLEEHDKKYHNGQFNPDTMECGKRDELKKKDDADEISSANGDVDWNSLESVSSTFKSLGDELKARSEELSRMDEKYKNEQNNYVAWNVFHEELSKKHEDMKYAYEAYMKSFAKVYSFSNELEKHGYSTIGDFRYGRVVKTNLDWNDITNEDIEGCDSISKKFSKFVDEYSGGDVYKRIAKALTLLQKRFGFTSMRYGTENELYADDGKTMIPADTWYLEASKDKLAQNFKPGLSESDTASDVLQKTLKVATEGKKIVSAWYNYKGWKEGHNDRFEITIER